MIIVPILREDENWYLGSWSVFLKNKQLISGKAGIEVKSLVPTAEGPKHYTYCL